MDRTDFRETVFARDGNKCVVCGQKADDAHHLLERKLWSDGDYIADNGVSLCNSCHISAEQTRLSVEELREAAGITTVVVPDHLFSDGLYDKWGNLILEDGSRLPGPLYEDTSVQKALRTGGAISLFRTHWKYPRTLHLPWSGGLNVNDEKQIPSLDSLVGQEVVVTEKMDGENTTMYHDFIHARSVSSGGHPSRSWVKNLHSKIAHDIPVGYRVVGENLFAAHSVRYDNLPSYFMMFSIWHRDVCMSWDETVEWAELLGLDLVPVLYEGVFDEAAARKLAATQDRNRHEGYVVRARRSFFARDFHLLVAKYQRDNHVTTGSHWMAGPVTTNGLA